MKKPPLETGALDPARYLSSTERFHSLDATRAFALTLGVLFHAAWSFVTPAVPSVFSAPVVDTMGHGAFGWFFFTSHSFRMQVFFLIAGFFARLLYQRRGVAGFMAHRLVRVGVPLVVGWFVLFPLTRAAWVWGGNVSGRNLIELPLPLLFQLMFEKGMMFVPAAQGGMFSLTHLWFLYYLLWLYAIVMAVRAVLVRALESSRLRNLADRMLGQIANSPWSIPLLTVVTGVFLWRMDGWTGVDTPVGTLVPSIPVLVLYGTFFVIGWLLHRQTPLLDTFAKRWKWRMAAGLLVSVGCYFATLELGARGYVAGSFRASYPYLSPDQIADWQKFAAVLQSPANSGAARPELMNLWQRIPAPARSVITQLPANPDGNRKAGICDAINKLLIQENLFSAPTSPPRGIPHAAKAQFLSSEHRATLEVLFGGAIRGNPKHLPSYSVVKCANAMAYAAMMWLLAFGTIGFFHAMFPAHSAAWRYVADSAYWIYLMHLPLVAFLQGWMWKWQLPPLLKFIVLLGVAFLFLFATYHYLVRSTFVGRLLNGQRFPFTAHPFTASAVKLRTSRPSLDPSTAR